MPTRAENWPVVPGLLDLGLDYPVNRKVLSPGFGLTSRIATPRARRHLVSRARSHSIQPDPVAGAGVTYPAAINAKTGHNTSCGNHAKEEGLWQDIEDRASLKFEEPL
jgi:hypothetical protein